MSLEYKSFQIDGVKEVAGKKKLYGYASIKGNVDSYGDIVVDGAYKALDETVKSGFICESHRWDRPLGYFTKAVEDDKGLYVEYELHSTPEAQALLTWVSERIAAGKTVGMSIGYKTIKCSYGEVDGDEVRYLEEIEVREASITLLPANDEAMTVGLKSRARAEQFELIAKELLDYKSRIADILKLNRSQKQVLNRKGEVEQLITLAQSILNEFDIETTNVEEKTDQDSISPTPNNAVEDTNVEVKDSETADTELVSDESLTIENGADNVMSEKSIEDLVCQATAVLEITRNI